jgi:pimeloyl-ACP methyl ester carboxylesterase
MTSTVTLPSGTVAYDERGSGPAVVMFASGAHSRSDYDELRDRLHERAAIRTIAMDWPGHGDSPDPTSATSGPTVAATGQTTTGAVTDWADVAEQFVERLVPEGAVIAGNSIGGFSSGRLAVRRPELVRGLILIDAGGFDPPNAAARAFCAAMGRPGFLRAIYPRFSAWYMRAQTDADRRARAHAIANTRKPATLARIARLWSTFTGPEHDLLGSAARIAAPTLVVSGRNDPVIPLAVGRRAAEAIPGATMLEVDAGHLPHTSAPDAIAGPVLDLIGRDPDPLQPVQTSAPGGATGPKSPLVNEPKYAAS